MLTNDRQRTELKALVAELKAAGTITDAMTTGQAMDALMALDQDPPRLVVPNRELRRGIDPAEYEALTDAKKRLVALHLAGEGSVDLKDANVRQALESAFPTGTNTRAAIAQRLTKKQSRLALRVLPEPTYHQLAVALGRA